jgi:hypothetical protein
MQRTLALGLVLLFAGCGSGDPAPPSVTAQTPGTAEDHGLARVTGESTCSECIVELAVTRTPGPPNTELRSFAAEPDQRYRISVELPGDGSPTWVVLTGATLVRPGPVPPGGFRFPMTSRPRPQ